MVMYIISMGALNSFYDYCIAGVETFSNYISYFELVDSNNICISLLSIIIPISFIYLFINTIILNEKTKEKQILYVMFAYSVASFFVVIPISDNIHFLIGSLPAIICLIYILNCLTRKFLNKESMQKFFKPYLNIFIGIFTNFMVSVVLAYSIILIYNYVMGDKQYGQLEHYNYIPISNSLCENIKNVDEYIKASNKKDIYILDSSSAVYMIPLDRYNKDYDMLLKGNLGKDGEEKIIKRIEENKNCTYLILKDNYQMNWQTPINIINYVKTNTHKIDEIEIFDVYSAE